MTEHIQAMEPELKSCGVLVVRGDPIRSFLLMKHPDRWDLPKGHVDPGETEVECALRELVEETGIPGDAVHLAPDFRYEHRYFVQYKRTGGDKKLKALVIFLGYLLREVEIEITEHHGYQWFDWNPPHDIQEMTINPLLSHLQKYLKESGN